MIANVELILDRIEDNLAINLPTTKGSAARAELLCRQTHWTFSMETYVDRQLEDQMISLFPIPWPLDTSLERLGTLNKWGLSFLLAQQWENWGAK